MVGHDALQHSDLTARVCRDTQNLALTGHARAFGKATDQSAGQVLQERKASTGGIKVRDPAGDARESIPGGSHSVGVRPGSSLVHGVEHLVAVPGHCEELRIDVAIHHSVLKVVDGVGDIIRKVHDLGFKTQLAPGQTIAHPVEDLPVILIDTEFLSTSDIRLGRFRTPGILHAR